MKINLKVLDKRIGDGFPIPDYSIEGDAGIDLRAMIDEPIELYPGETAIVPTGIAIEMLESDMVGIITPRSGLGSRGLVLSNLTGVIDSGYTGEIKLTPWNRNKPRYRYSWQNRRIFDNKTNVDPIVINPGDRIAQLIFFPIIRAEFNIVDELGVTDRGGDGFGSTGVGIEKSQQTQTEEVENSTIEEETDWSQLSDDTYEEMQSEDSNNE